MESKILHRCIIEDIKGVLIHFNAETGDHWVGMGMFKAPSRHGKNNRSLSSLQQGSLPFRAGIKIMLIQ